MLKRINEYIIEVKGELIDDCHEVNVIILGKDNIYKEKTLFYSGSLDTFNNMSEINLINLMDKLIKLEQHSKFSLQQEVTFAIR